MSTTVEKKSKPLDHRKELEGRKFRFEVKSAEEAVTLIRERLGETAKVISVKQMEGKGLGKLLSSPKLEIVAEVPVLEPEKEETAELERSPEEASLLEEEKEKFEQVEKETTPATNAVPVAKEKLNSLAQEFAQDMMPPTDHFRKSVSPSKRDESVYSSHNRQRSTQKSAIESFLINAGFTNEFINILKNEPVWQELSSQNTRQGLATLYHWMRNTFRSKNDEPLSQRVAFVGTPGTGKTSALCRFLSHQVFHEKIDTHVVKVDSNNPNPDDELAIFCDIMGTPLLRNTQQVENLPQTSRLLLDTGGISLDEEEEWEQLCTQLDDYGVWSKVLVINAAYDIDLIKKAFSQASRLGVTHFALTHLDEVTNTNKLWSLVLFHKCTPLLANYGQSITNEYSLNVFDYLLNNAFPRDLISA